MQHETFAPILYLIPVDSLEEAIEQQNATAYGLSSGLFTRRLDAAELYLSHRGSDCGIANVNLGTSGAEIGGAFGGEKDTGGPWQAWREKGARRFHEGYPGARSYRREGFLLHSKRNGPRPGFEG